VSASPEGELTEPELLAKGIEEIGIADPGSCAAKLLAYAREIEEWNPRMGLVSSTGRDLVVRHLLDSLAGAPELARVRPGGLVVDVGSGAGLPGIPLAVAREDLAFLLLDRSSKRCTFLEHCVSLLGLRNTRVLRAEVRSLREQADAVVMRAVSPLTVEFLRSTGIVRLAPLLIAYKGTLERARAELEAVRGLYGGAELIPLRVPFLEEERHLVIITRRRADDGRACPEA
jgi:16S rRNA (guanine527-N7)-methyltransferase